jgi:hypothetical protein
MLAHNGINLKSYSTKCVQNPFKLMVLLRAQTWTDVYALSQNVPKNNLNIFTGRNLWNKYKQFKYG